MNEILDPKFDRVTSVLSPFSGLSNIDPEILKRAAYRGTQVHLICDAIVKGLPILCIDPSIQGYIESFYQWFEGKHIINTPSRFFCEELLITGEVDIIYASSDGLTLVDLKTPARESKTWSLQGSAYAYLARQKGYEIKKIEFVKLEKSGKASKCFFYQDQMDLFIKCLQVYRYFFKTSSNNILEDF